jgi:tRNA-dihydrouridine synthase B
MNWIKPLKLGSLTLSSNIIYSPLTGWSDYPFRQIAALFSPGLMFCEMVKIEALLHHESNVRHLLDYDDNMRPIGAQIFGSNPKQAGAAARIIESFGFDVIDLNCGCPVDKVTQDGSGSALLKTPELIGEMIANMRAAVAIPITLKIRIGWDQKHRNGIEIIRIAEEAGVHAITVHGRTQSEKYKGRADWNYIKECKSCAKTIPIIGSGDVFTAKDGISLLQYTGSDGILIARGLLGQPWIANEIRELDKGISPLPLSSSQFRDILFEHMKSLFSYYPEHYALLTMQRIAGQYLRHRKEAKRIRGAFSRIATRKELEKLIIHGI